MAIIKLQTLINERTGRVIPVETLWAVLGQMYDLDTLDDMVSLSQVVVIRFCLFRDGDGRLNIGRALPYSSTKGVAWEEHALDRSAVLRMILYEA